MLFTCQPQQIKSKTSTCQMLFPVVQIQTFLAEKTKIHNWYPISPRPSRKQNKNNQLPNPELHRYSPPLNFQSSCLFGPTSENPVSSASSSSLVPSRPSSGSRGGDSLREPTPLFRVSRSSILPSFLFERRERNHPTILKLDPASGP